MDEFRSPIPTVKQLAGIEKWPSQEKAKQLIDYRYEKERRKGKE